MDDFDVIWWGMWAVILAYTLGFVFVAVVKAARKGEFVIGRTLRLGNIFGAVLDGLTIPAGVTVVGLFIALVLTGAQECPHGRGDCDIAGFWEIFLRLFLMVQGIVIIYSLAIVGRYCWRQLSMRVLQPLGRGITRVFRSARARIPVSW